MATSDSLTFDGNRVQDEQEEELKQEEAERQQQLKDLLANAFDDLEADDSCSVASDESIDSGRHSNELGQKHQWSNGCPVYHASTPVSEAKAPPLVTPMIQRRFSTPLIPNPQSKPLFHSNPAFHYRDTLYQENDITSGHPQAFDDITQQPDHDLIDEYQHQYHPASFSPSQRVSNAVYTNGYQGNNDEGDNTVFINQGEPISLQEKFFKEGPGSAKTQLEILYQAKSRQLQELQEKYELLQLETTKEIRMLRHEVALLEGSKQGAELSVKQLQNLLSQNKEAKFDLQKKLETIETQHQQLKDEHGEVLQQLHAAEASIESLNNQVFAISSSDTIERLREQHDMIISSMKQQHESELADLNEHLAVIKHEFDKQNSGIEAAKMEIKQEKESIAKERLEHADLVNRLTNSLKESQRQTQELLGDSSGVEMSKLKLQIQQATASKSVTEQLCDTLKKEVADLKEHIKLYESAVITGSYDNYVNCADESWADLGLKPPPTDKLTMLKKSLGTSNDDGNTTTILRRELQKCLTSIKEKRNELSALRHEYNQKMHAFQNAENKIFVLNDELERVRIQLKEQSIELNLYKTATNEGSSLSEVRFRTQHDALVRDRQLLEEENKSLNERIEFLTTNEAKLLEINAELNSKMAEMVDDFDHDKKAALSRCEQTLERHNSELRELMKAELVAEYEIKTQKLESHYDAEISRLKSFTSSITQELDEVKRLYIQVCQEKGLLEEHERTTLELSQQEIQKALETTNQFKALWESEKKQLSQNISDLEDEKSTLSNTIKVLEDRLHTLIQEQTSNKVKADSERMVNRIEELQLELQSERQKNTVNYSEVSRLEVMLAEERAKVHHQEQELNSKDAKVKESHNLGEQLKLQVVALQVECEQLKSYIETDHQLNISKHNQQDIPQLQELSNQEVDRLNAALTIADETVAKLEAELSSERTRLLEAKSCLEKLEGSLASERKAQSITKNSLLNLQNDLSFLRTANKKLSSDVKLIESEFEAEKKSHTQTKMLNIKLDTELKAERSNSSEIKLSLDKLKQKQQTIEVDLEVYKENSSRNQEEISELKSQITQEQQLYEALKTSHKQALMDLEETKAELIRKSSETSQLRIANSRLLSEMNSLSGQLEKQSALLTSNSISLDKPLEEAKQSWMHEFSSPVQAENTMLKAKIDELQGEALNNKKLLSQSDTERKAQIANMANQVCELENRCESYQSCTEQLRQNLESMVSQVNHLKLANKKLQSDLAKTSAEFTKQIKVFEAKLLAKDQDLASVEHEHNLTIQSLKQKMVSLRNEHSIQMEALRSSQVSTTPTQDHSSEDDVRNQYETALMRIREEVLRYVEETNKSATKFIKDEIHKAKQSTARQLRNYYIKTFKQSLADNESTSEEKIYKVERNLDRAVTAIMAPSNLNTDSILHIPDQLWTDPIMSTRTNPLARQHQGVCLAEKDPNCVLSTRSSIKSAHQRQPPNGLENNIPSNNSRNTPINTEDIIRELGLSSTVTSPPRQYNPPAEKL